jgi:hypothetical protein
MPSISCFCLPLCLTVFVRLCCICFVAVDLMLLFALLCRAATPIALHMQAAVKVLDSSNSSSLPLHSPFGAAAGSLSLTALTSSSLKHANLVSTLAWAVVSQGKQTSPSPSPSAAAPSATAEAAAVRSVARQQAFQGLVGCSEGSAVEVCSAVAAGGSQTWLVQEYCDRGSLQVGF